MTQIAVQQQIDAITNASIRANKSKESAIKFLQDAGILKTKLNASQTKQKKNI